MENVLITSLFSNFLLHLIEELITNSVRLCYELCTLFEECLQCRYDQSTLTNKCTVARLTTSVPSPARTDIWTIGNEDKITQEMLILNLTCI